MKEQPEAPQYSPLLAPGAPDGLSTWFSTPSFPSCASSLSSRSLPRWVTTRRSPPATGFFTPLPVPGAQLLPLPQALDNADAPTLLPGDPTPLRILKPALIGHSPVVQPPGPSLGLGALRQPGLESRRVKGTAGLGLGARSTLSAPPSLHKRPSPRGRRSQPVGSRALSF
ncbi:Hypothetical predicted protein [Marmota monax]|uniref:Uncharacterized protein n=1 Tax=Marmota monax TaxID=9995 RepID=A0A5E4AIC7_MARMO|nr:Hypothetical predicted protein [Marmota monax]